MMAHIWSPRTPIIAGALLLALVTLTNGVAVGRLSPRAGLSRSPMPYRIPRCR